MELMGAHVLTRARASSNQECYNIKHTVRMHGMTERDYSSAHFLFPIKCDVSSLFRLKSSVFHSSFSMFIKSLTMIA